MATEEFSFRVSGLRHVRGGGLLGLGLRVKGLGCLECSVPLEASGLVGILSFGVARG